MIADTYHDEINARLDSGGDEAEKLIRTFYSRVGGRIRIRTICLGDWPIMKIGLWDLNRHKNLVIQCDTETGRWSYKGGGWVSIATLAEHLCLPVAFFEGFAACFDAFVEVERTNFDWAVQMELTKKHDETLRMREAAERGVLQAQELISKAIYDPSYKTVLKRLRGLAHRQCVTKESVRSSILELASLMDLERSFQCHGMPAVDLCQGRFLHDIIAADPFSGIYTAWDIDGCAYVGKSVNIPSRLKGHTTIREDDLIVTIPMDAKEIHFAECFYIWQLRPSRNNEGKLTSKTESQ